MFKFKNHMTRSFVTEPNSGVSDDHSFQKIEFKLKTKSYLTPFDWSIDVMYLLYELMDGYQEKHPAHIIVEDSIKWFEDELSKMPHSQEEFNSHYIKKAIRYIDACIEGLSEKSSSKDPFQNVTVTSEQIKLLQEMINNIKDPAVLVEAVKILKKNIKKLPSGNTIVIDRSKVSRKCFLEIEKMIFSNQKE